MGFFGDVDATAVPEDPFHVDDGTYLAVLTEFGPQVSNDGEKHGLAFKWVIKEEDSEFNNFNLSDWKTYHPEATDEDLTVDQRKDLSRLKNRLIAIGVPEEDLNTFDPADYVGTEAYVTVKNSVDANDPDKKYRNIVKVRLPE